MAQHISNTTGEKSPAVYTSQKWKNFYQSFCTNRNNTDGLNIPVFDKYTNIYTLCCIIGFKEGKRTPLERRDSLFTLEQIDQNEEWPLLIAVAWLDQEKDMSLFSDSKKILEICSEYAETGIEKLVSIYPFNEIFRDGKLIIGKEPEDFRHDILSAIAALKAEYLEDLI